MNELRKVQINPFTTKCGIQSAIYDKKRKLWYSGRQIRQKEETALGLLRQNEEILLNCDRLRKYVKYGSKR